METLPLMALKRNDVMLNCFLLIKTIRAKDNDKEIGSYWKLHYIKYYRPVYMNDTCYVEINFCNQTIKYYWYIQLYGRGYTEKSNYFNRKLGLFSFLKPWKLLNLAEMILRITHHRYCSYDQSNTSTWHAYFSNCSHLFMWTVSRLPKQNYNLE